MSSTGETSDVAILDLLRQSSAQGVTELASATGVTATAVRQRLNRLMAQGLIERNVERYGRGRPSHKYSLTVEGLRQTGTNYADLATALWKEVRAIKDPEVRRGLLRRLVNTLAGSYASKLRGTTLTEKMQSLGELMGERKVPVQVDVSGDLPVLTALACPYPDLAQEDRSVCAMERMLFSEMLGEDVHLTECRLDGGTCCTFEVN